LELPYREIFRKHTGITSPATFKKAVIATVHSESATADVYIVGNAQSLLKNIPLSSAVDANDVKVGDKCRVDMFDETNPDDSVVAYTYGRKKSNT
jgi:hypothetical protein